MAAASSETWASREQLTTDVEAVCLFDLVANIL